MRGRGEKREGDHEKAGVRCRFGGELIPLPFT